MPRWPQPSCAEPFQGGTPPGGWGCSTPSAPPDLLTPASCFSTAPCLCPSSPHQSQGSLRSGYGEWTSLSSPDPSGAEHSLPTPQGNHTPHFHVRGFSQLRPGKGRGPDTRERPLGTQIEMLGLRSPSLRGLSRGLSRKTADREGSGDSSSCSFSKEPGCYCPPPGGPRSSHKVRATVLGDHSKERKESLYPQPREYLLEESCYLQQLSSYKLRG